MLQNVPQAALTVGFNHGAASITVTARTPPRTHPTSRCPDRPPANQMPLFLRLVVEVTRQHILGFGWQFLG